MKKEEYKVSMIIPIYNVRDYIAESLGAALNQDFDSIEYILVDDASPDDSMEIIAKMIADSTRESDVKIIHHEKNMGLSAARNTGMMHATGVYIFFMDSDDEIVPDCISKHYDALQKNHADYTVASVRLVGTRSVLVKPMQASFTISPCLQFLTNRYNVGAWNKLYCRKFIEENKLRFAEGLLHEDFLWSYQVSQKARALAVVEAETYLYKIRKGSITTSKVRPKKIDDLIKIINVFRRDWKDAQRKDIRKAFCNYYDSLRFYTAISLLRMEGAFSRKKELYLELQTTMLDGGDRNKYCFFLKLPCHLFCTVFFIPLWLYKRMQ